MPGLPGQARRGPPWRAPFYNALQRDLPVSGWGFHPQPRSAPAPAAGWIPGWGSRSGMNAGFACIRLGIPSPAALRACPGRQMNSWFGFPFWNECRVCLCQAGDSIPSRAPRLPRPPDEFLVWVPVPEW